MAMFTVTLTALEAAGIKGAIDSFLDNEHDAGADEGAAAQRAETVSQMLAQPADAVSCTIHVDAFSLGLMIEEVEVFLDAENRGALADADAMEADERAEAEAAVAWAKRTRSLQIVLGPVPEAKPGATPQLDCASAISGAIEYLNLAYEDRIEEDQEADGAAQTVKQIITTLQAILDQKGMEENNTLPGEPTLTGVMDCVIFG